MAYCRDGTARRNVYAEVPQGSVIDLLLRNLVYDELLKVLDPVKDLNAIADDLAVVIIMRKLQDIGDRVRKAMKLDTSFHLAQEETEIILLTRRRVPKVSKIDVGGGEIITRNMVKYLEVLLDNTRRYSPHLEQVCDKAERFVRAIRSLLPNVNGPTDTARKLYYGVWDSAILYAAPIWPSALSIETNKKILISAQRTALVRTSTAYRTVSHGHCVW